MANVTYEEVVELADQLPQVDQIRLLSHLQQTLRKSSATETTPEQLIAELKALRESGAFEKAESLRNKYARPGTELSEEELNAYLHEIATQYEEDFEENHVEYDD